MLIAQSEVFGCMLSDDIKEAGSRIIDENQTPSPDMLEFIRWLHLLVELLSLMAGG